MDPEKENTGETPTGEEETAVVVDLNAELDKQEKPVETTAAGNEPGADKQTQADKDDKSAPQGDDDAPITTRKDFDKRLKREIRQKLQARAESATVTQENERLRLENEQLRASRAAPDRDEPPSTADLDARIGTAQGKLEKAIEDGDTKEQARLQAELAQLGGEKGVRLAQPRRESRQEEPPPRQQQPRKPTLSPTAQAFLASNSEWWDDPTQNAVKSAVIAIDNQLLMDGSDPTSEAHYERIRKRAKAIGLKVDIRMPFDEADDMGTQVDLNDDPPPRRQSPPQGTNGNNRQRVNTDVRDARAGKVVLTEDDKKNMRTFKLDPANPAHLRAYAKARQEQLLQDAGQ